MYADLDNQNLMNADPDSGQQNHQMTSKAKKTKLFSNLEISNFFLSSDLKNIISCEKKKQKMCWLKNMEVC